MDTTKEKKWWEKDWKELIDTYKRGGEGANTAVNTLRKEPNSVLEQEIVAFIAHVEAQTIAKCAEAVNPYIEDAEQSYKRAVNDQAPVYRHHLEQLLEVKYDITSLSK